MERKVRLEALESLLDESSVPELLEDISATCKARGLDISDNGDSVWFEESKLLDNCVKELDKLHETEDPETHDHDKEGCRYLGLDMWDCGKIDNP